MVDQISKYISKLSKKEKDTCNKIMDDIFADNITLYDVKKLFGHTDIYRIRKGDIRVIFRKNEYHIRILKIANRDENTYKNY